MHHPVATSATAVTAAQLVRTRVRAQRLESSDRPVKGSVACVGFEFSFFFLHENAVTHSAGVNVDVKSIFRDCLCK